MIEIKYFAADMDIEQGMSVDSDYLHIRFKNEEDENLVPLNGTDLSEIEGNIKEIMPIENYANFFGEGIDLFDESIVLPGIEDYLGYIPPIKKQGSVDIVVSWQGTVSPSLQNGITIVFNKYTCGKISIFPTNKGYTEYELASKSNEDSSLLQEIVHIPFEPFITISETEKQRVYGLKLRFSEIPENYPINIRGIVIGKVLAIEDILSLDLLSETTPSGEDLPINETNITAVINEDFDSKYGQKVVLYDNNVFFESNIVKTVKEIDSNIYDIKIRNHVERLNKNTIRYPQNFDPLGFVDYDWNNVIPTVEAGLEIVRDSSLKIDIPDNITGFCISPFLKPCSKRKLLQQIAWASCCGIDTTYSENLRLVPLLASDNASPLEIKNEDGRILKTNVTNGTKYSKILWKKTRYVRHKEDKQLGEIEFRFNNQLNCFVAELMTDNPIAVSGIDVSYEDYTTIYSESPYYTSFVYDIEDTWDNTSPFTVAVYGYEYNKLEEVVQIPTGNVGGETLEIANQELFPLDDENVQNKVAQLKKWYSENDTLSATIVDNASEIRCGKLVKIQLKKGDFFKGIVTKVVRNNISLYHTVDLEVHRWN